MWKNPTTMGNCVTKMTTAIFVENLAEQPQLHQVMEAEHLGAADSLQTCWRASGPKSSLSFYNCVSS